MTFTGYLEEVIFSDQTSIITSDKKRRIVDFGILSKLII